MQYSIFLIPLLLFLISKESVQGCQITTQIAARRMTVDDGVISATIYAGHFKKMLTLNTVWSSSSSSPSPSNRSKSVILLPPNHQLLGMDVPDNWYDNENALTYETLIFSTRDSIRQWHVSEGATVTPTTGVLYLGPDSSIWLSHDAVVFTGSQLQFFGRQAGVACSALDALSSAGGGGGTELNTAVEHKLSIISGSGEPVEEWNNITLEWGVDNAQTLIPAAAANVLLNDWKYTLLLDDSIFLVNGQDLVDALLVASDAPSFSSLVEGSSSLASHRIVLGRRLLQRMAAAWATDSEGHVAVAFPSSLKQQQQLEGTLKRGIESVSGSGLDTISDGIYWFGATLGVLLIALSVYWLSYLGVTLQIAYDPTLLSDCEKEEGVIVTRLDLLFGLLILALSITAHALMGVYGGHDVLFDASLETPLKAFVTSFWIGSIFIATLFAVLLLLAMLTRNLVSVQLYAMTVGMVASRGVLAVFLIGAGTTSPQLACTTIILLIFVYFPTVYATLVLGVHVLSDTPLYMPPETAGGKTAMGQGLRRLLSVLTFIVSLGLSILIGVTTAQWLILPFLNAVNGYYSPASSQAVSLIVLAIPLYVVSYSIGEQGKRLLKLPSLSSSPKEE